MPHGVASDKVIEAGDFVTFDFGSVYKGYHSDMTRTIVMGPASELQKKLYSIVLEAQKRGVAAVRAGITVKNSMQYVVIILKNMDIPRNLITVLVMA